MAFPTFSWVKSASSRSALIRPYRFIHITKLSIGKNKLFSCILDYFVLDYTNEVIFMPDYRELYAIMFRATEQAARILLAAQRECEELYLASDPPPLELFPSEEDLSEESCPPTP